MTDHVELDPAAGLWNRVFTVAPLVLVGTTEPTGQVDLAPKHMAMPLGAGPWFGFVCTPRHRTFQNLRRDGGFTVTYVRPDQVVLAALAAGPRHADEEAKPVVAALDLLPASDGRGAFVRGGHLFLECEVHELVGPFDEHQLVVGRVRAAFADEQALRAFDADDGDVVARDPLLAYLAPGRWAPVDRSLSFPFPAGFEP